MLEMIIVDKRTNINVNVKSYGNSDVASKTARGVSKALQDVDVFK